MIGDIKKNVPKIRKTLVEMAFSAKSSHLGSALSCVEILSSLYLGGVMNYNINDPEDDNRDRLILSKGHAAMALYAVLNQAGFISDEELDSFHKSDSPFQVHPKINIKKGIEHSSGSLGQGLPLACGIALAQKLKKKSVKVFVILGDGECNEGSNWEAAAFATHYKLDNLTVIIDKNKLQSSGETVEILSMEPFAEKWNSFGFDTIEVDGHNTTELITVLSNISRKPRAIIAHTRKGKGLSFTEDNVDWHFNTLTQKLYDKALVELGVNI